MSDEIVLPDGEAFYLQFRASWRWQSPFESATRRRILVGWLDGRSLARLGLMVYVMAQSARSRLSGCDCA